MEKLEERVLEVARRIGIRERIRLTRGTRLLASKSKERKEISIDLDELDVALRTYEGDRDRFIEYLLLHESKHDEFSPDVSRRAAEIAARVIHRRLRTEPSRAINMGVAIVNAIEDTIIDRELARRYSAEERHVKSVGISSFLISLVSSGRLTDRLCLFSLLFPAMCRAHGMDDIASSFIGTVTSRVEFDREAELTYRRSVREISDILSSANKDNIVVTAMMVADVVSDAIKEIGRPRVRRRVAVSEGLATRVISNVLAAFIIVVVVSGFLQYAADLMERYGYVSS